MLGVKSLHQWTVLTFSDSPASSSQQPKLFAMHGITTTEAGEKALHPRCKPMEVSKGEVLV